MGVCSSAISKKSSKGTIQKPQSASTYPTYNKPTKHSDQFEELRAKLRMEIKESPFNNYGNLLQDEIESEYHTSKYPNPYLFIKNKSYNDIFTETYAICYLKCEPILNIISDDQKKGNFLFFRLVIFLQSNVNDNKRKIDTAKKILLESYDQKQKKINIENLKSFVSAVSELCIEIIIYFGLIPSLLKKDELIRVLTDENYLLEDKYLKVELDDYYFAHNAKNTQLDLINIKNNWMDFIFIPILSIQPKEEQSFQIRESRFSFGNSTMNKCILDIKEASKEEIICRLAYMFDPFVLFESLVGNGITGSHMSLYNK